jgi:RND family efflux transporter MFP subunit
MSATSKLDRSARGTLGACRAPLVALAAVMLCIACGSSGPKPPPPPHVEVTDVLQQDVKIYGEWVATLDGFVNAQIQPQVIGYLIKQDYREGSLVHKGDVLFEIDPRPFQATLDLARAQLAQAQAQLGNANANLKRDIPEAEVSAIPRSQLETDTQAQAGASAGVQAAQATVEQAELNLGFTKVRSLITGIAGIAQVQVGNLVSLTTVLTGVSQVDPIKVYFPITGDEYLRIADQINPNTVDLLSGKQGIPLQLILSNGNTFGQPGQVLFADRQVDAQTGTIRIASAFPNPGNILRPGQYGRVRAVTEVRKGALLVPQRAVSELQGSYQVAVVGPDNRVSIRSVQTGPRVGAMWIIDRGLKAGERVVAEGTGRIHNGSLVAPAAFHLSNGDSGADPSPPQ